MCTLEDVNDYHRYAASFDTETKTIIARIDGELRGSAEFVDLNAACEPFGFAIGASYVFRDDNVMYGFIGKIDDVRVYNYSIAELNDIFAELFQRKDRTVRISGASAYWKPAFS